MAALHGFIGALCTERDLLEEALYSDKHHPLSQELTSARKGKPGKTTSGWNRGRTIELVESLRPRYEESQIDQLAAGAIKEMVASGMPPHEAAGTVALATEMHSRLISNAIDVAGDRNCFTDGTAVSGHAEAVERLSRICDAIDAVHLEVTSGKRGRRAGPTKQTQRIWEIDNELEANGQQAAVADVVARYNRGRTRDAKISATAVEYARRARKA